MIQGLCIFDLTFLKSVFLHDFFFSSYNDDEVNQVMIFLNNLLNGSEVLEGYDIGVVSPYKLQCKKIENACRKNGLMGITIGSSEIFQGQERKVMILSTVVSRLKHPGSFVSNPKVNKFYTIHMNINFFQLFSLGHLQRLNVVITRSQYLLIVVGDAQTLRGDSNWAAFIDYCSENGALNRKSQNNQQRNRRRRRNRR